MALPRRLQRGGNKAVSNMQQGILPRFSLFLEGACQHAYHTPCQHTPAGKQEAQASSAASVPGPTYKIKCFLLPIIFLRSP